MVSEPIETIPNDTISGLGRMALLQSKLTSPLNSACIADISINTLFVAYVLPSTPSTLGTKLGLRAFTILWLMCRNATLCKQKHREKSEVAPCFKSDIMSLFA